MSCRYVLRRTKQDFRAHREDADASGFLSEAKDALEVVKRQAVVYSMYARKHKSIMVRLIRFLSRWHEAGNSTC